MNLVPLRPRAVVVGLPGATLNAETAEVLRQLRPAGIILFKRNCQNPAQVAELTAQLRGFLPTDIQPLIFIDQEGGRVNRINFPYMGLPAQVFGQIYAKDEALGVHATRLNAFVIGAQLAQVGVTVDCAPVADVPVSGAHDVIGDRAFAQTPEVVSVLCGASISGFLAGGVFPVIKHLPGHGRACADSHLELPTVEASLNELENKDFIPFIDHPHCPFAMTAHILYKALDTERCATHSPEVIGFIRKQLGVTSILLSDDINMKALHGGTAQKAQKALDAGCDLALHCNGDLTEMAELCALPEASPELLERLKALPMLPKNHGDLLDEARDELERIMAPWVA